MWGHPIKSHGDTKKSLHATIFVLKKNTRNGGANMAITDFITTTLNLENESIESFDSIRKNDTIYLHVTLKDKHPECPFCGGKAKSKGYLSRSINHLPLSGTPSVIVWKRRRYTCKDCGKTFAEENPFGPDAFHQSYALLRGVANDLANIHFSLKDIAERNHISTTLVELYCDSFIQVPRLSLPENLGIDEIHSNMAKYGGSFLCVFVDNKERCLTEILPNRSKYTLSRFLENIPLSERSQVKYVTIDMWEPYKDVALRFFPNCVIAVDPFHVVKHLSDGFSSFRIDLMNRMPRNSPAYYLLKHWHKLLESDYDLDNEPRYNAFFHQKMNYRQLYDALLKLNPSLREAYFLKEQYRLFNRNATEDNCEAWFSSLLSRFMESDLSCYDEFISLLQHWKPEILNSFKRPYDDRKLSNALAENMNQKLNTLIRVSNGLNNFERFRCRAIYSLNWHISFALTNHLSLKKRKPGRHRGNYKKTDG